jgi:hypothetical protein
VNTTSSTMLTGALVVAGRWTEGKPVDAKVVVGVVVLVVALAAMPEELSKPFALLILLAATFRYGLPLAQKVSGQ